MPASDLKDIYIAELKDLVSANTQMQQFLSGMIENVSSDKLKDLIDKSVTGVAGHTETIRNIVNAYGGGEDKCRAMEGLVKEAKSHAVKANLSSELKDLAIIAQYQRMSHYGIAGIGTVAAYAKALGYSEDAQKLSKIVSDIYKADEYSSQLAEQAEKVVASKV